jgi:threonine aldolase
VDVLSLGGTKNGLPFGEAIVFFDRDLANEFGRRRMQGGQLASKMRFLAAPWLGVLKDGAWLRHAAHANAMAQRLADGLAGVPGTRLLAPVEANGVFIDLPLPVIVTLREKGWQFYEFIGATGVRLMCTWDTPVAAIDALIADICKLCEVFATTGKASS